MHVRPRAREGCGIVRLSIPQGSARGRLPQGLRCEHRSWRTDASIDHAAVADRAGDGRRLCGQDSRSRRARRSEARLATRRAATRRVRGVRRQTAGITCTIGHRVGTCGLPRSGAAPRVPHRGRPGPAIELNSGRPTRPCVVARLHLGRWLVRATRRRRRRRRENMHGGACGRAIRSPHGHAKKTSPKAKRRPTKKKVGPAKKKKAAAPVKKATKAAPAVLKKTAKTKAAAPAKKTTKGPPPHQRRRRRRRSRAETRQVTSTKIRGRPPRAEPARA